MINRKFLGVFLLSLVLTSLFIGVVSAQANIGEQILAELKAIKDKLGGGGLFEGSSIITRILMFFLVSLILYAVVVEMPFLKNKSRWITVPIVVIIGILSVFFLNKNEIYTALFAYNALGVTLTLILPLAAITVVSKSLYDGGNYIFSKIVWFVFILLLMYRIIWDPSAGSIVDNFGQARNLARIVFIGIFAFSIIMFFFGGRIWKEVGKLQLKGMGTNAGTAIMAHLESEIIRLSKEYMSLQAAGAPRAQLVVVVQEHNRNAHALRRLGGPNYPHLPAP